MDALGVAVPVMAPLWWAELGADGRLSTGRVGDMWSPTPGSLWWGNYHADTDDQVRDRVNAALIAPGMPYIGTAAAGLRRPPAAASGLSAIRALKNGVMRQYSAVKFTRGWDGVERFVRTLRALGYVRPSSTATDGYAVLDVLDAEGDIIFDYDVPTAAAFRYVKRKLRLAVEPECDIP